MAAAKHDFSVVIPAHNEAAVIERCLRALQSDPAISPEIVVACNGCRDETATIARRVAPQATVLEIARGSKILALNEGNAVAKVYPRFFLDADIVVQPHSLAVVAQVLAQNGEVRAAAPALDVDLAGCSWPVRAYYKVWLQQPYVRVGMVGSGLFGLSAAGIEQVGTFPEVVADDLYVRTRFASEQRMRVERDAKGAPVTFTVFPPRDLPTLLRIEGRRRAGDMQLKLSAHNSEHTARTTTGGSLLSALGKESGEHGRVGVLDIVCYLGIKIVGRQIARRTIRAKKQIVWERDESSRTV